MWILSVLILLIILNIIIIIHEFGHFICAKKFGVHIYEFSIGMGPLIKSHKGKDGIDYNIRALPIGGYVAMAGEVYDDDDKIDKNSLMCNKPWIQRVIILLAGVFNNFVLAIVVLFFSGIIWGCTYNTSTIADVQKDSAIYNAGIVEGDKIVAINGKKVRNWEKAQILLYFKTKDGSYKIDIEHKNGEVKTYNVSPTKTKDEDGNETQVFGFRAEVVTKKGLINSIKYSFSKFNTIVDTMILTLQGLFTGKLSINNLSGPVGMYEVVDSGLAYGLSYMIYLLALLSINVGFLNVLPFPAFDGGRVLFVIIEKIKGSPVNSELENKFHTVGFILLMILMVYITIKDVINLF